MNIVNLFPIEFFEFQNNHIDNQKIIQQLDELNGRVKNATVVSLLTPIHELPEFSELFSWFRECLEEIRVAQQYDCDKFEITTSWANKSLAGRGMHQNYHRHTLSMFSAVYYLTEGSPTIFEDPVIQRTQAQIEILRKNYQPFEQFQATPGKLVVFPSWVYHQTPPHVLNYDRCIISFNCLPTGNLNSLGEPDARCYISIKRPND